MKFRNPYFTENIMQDQPYCSLLLVAPYCDGACPGCQNSLLSDSDVIDFTVPELVQSYCENPFVDGITVAGLEICLSGEEFVRDLIEFIEKAAVPRVTIYSRFPAEYPKLRAILSRIEGIPTVQELYCKTGMYVQNVTGKKIVLNSSAGSEQTWTLSLASANQDFHVLKGNLWQRTAA
jgi:hypothetical protein